MCAKRCFHIFLYTHSSLQVFLLNIEVLHLAYCMKKQVLYLTQFLMEKFENNFFQCILMI